MFRLRNVPTQNVSSVATSKFRARTCAPLGWPEHCHFGAPEGLFELPHQLTSTTPGDCYSGRAPSSVNLFLLLAA